MATQELLALEKNRSRPSTAVADFLRPHARIYGRELAETTLARGLAVTPKDGIRVPIPITATPVVLAAVELRRRCALAAQLASAGVKMARAILSGAQREQLLRSLGPLERQVVEASQGALHRLAISRVDFFVSDRPWALELNATIPAMPAYSDIAAESFIDVVGRHAGLKAEAIEELQTQNGSNVRALYEALLAGYALERPGRAPRRMAILVRRQDPQISEIHHLRERFEAWGTETCIVHPDEVSGATAFTAQGKAFDLVYRHLFVRRLEDNPSPYLVDFFSRRPDPRAVLFNAPAAQVETKTTFALLSQAASEPGLAAAAGLTGEELETIRHSVPWTRTFSRSPGTDGQGSRVTDIVELVAAKPDAYVLKRAWDYGGKAVFVGKMRAELSFRERAQGAYGEALGWRELCARAAEDAVGGGFVVQEIVDSAPEHHLLCTGEGLVETELYVDFSAYASVGLGMQPAWGAACRGSPSRIVNIAGGGGVLPLLTEDVYGSLAAALARV